MKRNLPPRIELAFPGGDVQVSPLQELMAEATVWDDVGVTAAGVTVRIKGTTREIDFEVDGFKADKKEIRVPAFYDGGGQWRVRFTPREAGNYRLRVSVGKPRRSKPVRPRNLVQDEFMYDGTRARNFVRVDPERTQRFVLDSGKPYFPIGDNCTLSLWSPYLELSPDMFRWDN